MGNVIIFPRLKKGERNSEELLFDSFEAIIEKFILDVEANQLEAAEIKLKRLLAVESNRTKHYLKFYLSKRIQSEAIDIILRTFSETLKTGSANEFVELISQCFGGEEIESINLYLCLKKTD